jgi:hypothetical protein
MRGLMSMRLSLESNRSEPDLACLATTLHGRTRVRYSDLMSRLAVVNGDYDAETNLCNSIPSNLEPLPALQVTGIRNISAKQRVEPI